MAGKSLRYYLSLPPGVIVRKIEERTRKAKKRLRAKIRGDLSASDREFRLAVKPGLSFYRRDLEQEPRFFLSQGREQSSLGARGGSSRAAKNEFAILESLVGKNIREYSCHLRLADLL
jgi:hypothetical protein